MRQITTISGQPNQNIVIILDDGTKANLTMNYFSGQRGWFYTLNYNSGQFIANNRRMVTSPNMLNAFQNIIPFGLAVTTTDGYEPIFINDFISGRASLFVLNQEDVAIIQTAIENA